MAGISEYIKNRNTLRDRLLPSRYDKTEGPPNPEDQMSHDKGENGSATTKEPGDGAKGGTGSDSSRKSARKRKKTAGSGSARKSR